MQRKLGKATDQRLALLKNQVSYLLWNGKIETTLARAKEVQKLAEKNLTLAINTYQDVVKVQKTKVVNGKETKVDVINDGPKKLAARRKLISNLVDIQETKGQKESKSAYNLRTKDHQDAFDRKGFQRLRSQIRRAAPNKSVRRAAIPPFTSWVCVAATLRKWQSSKYCPSELLHEKTARSPRCFYFQRNDGKIRSITSPSAVESK